ncbi:Bpu10I family restriction endonuclease [Helicobacter sp. 23-1045]
MSDLEFLQQFDKGYIHAKNMLTKFNKGEHLDFLRQCIEKYKIFDREFGVDNLELQVNAWNQYLNFVRNNNHLFTSQSKFESTILEEVLFRLFKHLKEQEIKIGGAKAYSNLYFSPANFDEFKIKDNIKINHKDQDFAIYKNVIFALQNDEQIEMSVPVVAFECKTYLDKTMLESSVATAEKIKAGNPSCRFCIVTERYEVDKSVDIRSSRIDQIYVLKKDATKANHKTKEIDFNVVKTLYDDTIEYLQKDWTNIEKNIRENGIVL